MHALDAIDLLLQRNGDRRFHHLGIGADIIAGDVDLGRRQVRIECDGQGRNAYCARKNDEQCADRGKNRPFNEKVNQAKTSSPAPSAAIKVYCLSGSWLAYWLNRCAVDQKLRT